MHVKEIIPIMKVPCSLSAQFSVDYSDASAVAGSVELKVRVRPSSYCVRYTGATKATRDPLMYLSR